MEKLIKFFHIMIYSEYVFCCFFQLSDTIQTLSPIPIITSTTIKMLRAIASKFPDWKIILVNVPVLLSFFFFSM